jgi:hypothetical protein
MGRDHNGRLRYEWEDNITMDLMINRIIGMN